VAELSRRALGRSTLHRQLLLTESELSVPDALRHLVGLQGQVPRVPYHALWLRLRGFRPAWLAGPMADRSVVRATLMRTTIHTVLGEDAVWLRPLVDPLMRRTFGGTAWARSLRGVDIEPAMEHARELLEAEPRTRAELTGPLAARFPDADPVALSWAASYLLPVLQPTPRGLWGESGRSALTTYRAWLGDRPPSHPGVDDVVPRYLAAFGPATVRDIQAWSGLTRLAEVVTRLGDRLRRLRGPDGVELVDIPDGPLPDEDVPAPVRMLPEYDNVVLGYADRSRVLADGEYRPGHGGHGGPGGAVGSVMVDGLVRAMWSMRRSPGRVAVEVRPAARLTAAHRDDIEVEARRMAGFLAPREEVSVEITT